MSDDCAAAAPLHSAWLDGMLDDDGRAFVEAHLAGCAACRAEVESLGRTRMLVRNLPVRRLPDGVDLLPDLTRSGAGPRRQGPALAVTGGRVVAAALAVVAGMLGGAAFALGGGSSPEDRLVNVPMDLYVADHIVHTVGGPLSTPVVVDGRR
ncbi:MAG TPA: zf-HC2 domain-containing protein [Egibacteraceae bacterium]|jgi:anti-sigma factor RsiW|nr:zf-HC2 domain-containing protein [Egibacteraceae bacterium]